MKQKFNELIIQFPNHSTIILFSKLVRGRKLNQRQLMKWFNELVWEGDWIHVPKKELMKFYTEITQVEDKPKLPKIQKAIQSLKKVQVRVKNARGAIKNK